MDRCACAYAFDRFVLQRHGIRLLVPAAGLSAGRAAFLRSPERADTGIAAIAAGTLLGMATMLAGVILSTDRGNERANASHRLV